MTALSEPTVQSAEEHVLRTFVRHEATTISTSLLFEEAGSFARADIARALTQLEREHVLLRYTWDGTDWVTLTLLGIARRGGAAVAPSVRPQIVFEHPHRVRDYRVFVLGIERDGGTWAGWIEFVPVDGTQRLRTGQETSQPNRDALVYWATGLEDVYLEGAMARATA